MIAAFVGQVAQWPNIVIVLLFACGSLAMLALARAIGRHVLPRGEDHTTEALDTFKMLGPLTGVFLAFCLVQSIGLFRTADSNVSREGTDLLQVDRSLAALPPGPQVVAARRALRAYVRHLVEDEWKALSQGKADTPATTEAFIQLQLAVEAAVADLPQDVKAASDLDKNLNDVQDDRAGRLGIAHGGLPNVVWWVLTLLFALIFACGAFLRGAAARHPLPILYVTGLSLLAALLFVFDRPFQGDVSISPKPIENVLVHMEARLK